MCKKKKESLLDIPCACEFCEHAILINDETNVLCSKKGIVSKDFSCKKYLYDPLKRIPRKLPPMPKLSEDDLL